MKVVVLGALLLLGVPQSAVPAPADQSAKTHEPFEATSHRRFDDVEHWKEVFDAPGRAEWQKPEEVIGVLGLEAGMVVADLGAGTGYFSPHLSKAVGKTGAVLAVETEPNLVAYLRERAEAEGTANVVPVLASSDNPRLPHASVDLVLIVDTFHHIDDRLTYFRSMKQVLRQGGRVAIVDWREGKLPEGPAPDHKLAPEAVVAEMRSAGYDLVREHDFLPYQYFLVFRPG